MSKKISVTEIVNHTEYIYDLLRQQKYEPIGVELTIEERSKLFNFLYVYSEFEYKIRYNDHYPNEDLKAVVMSQEAYYDMDGEIKDIINKIGVNVYEIFVSNNDKIELDDRITKSLFAHGIARVGEYTIYRTLGNPISADSIELKYLSTKDKINATIEYREGVPKFEIRDKDNNKLYYHGTFGNSIDMRAMGDINYKGLQLNVDYLTLGDGVFYLLLDLDNVLNFFETIEKLLSDQLSNKYSNDLYRKRIMTEEDQK